MKLITISDTHCQLSKLDLPDGDLLLHAGDATYQGTLQEFVAFDEELELAKIKHKYKYGIIFVPGNHDFLFEKQPNLARQIVKNAKVLMDEAVEIEGIKIYGSAWTPEFYDWAFNLPRGAPLKEKWDLIPEDTNVLITHGPPFRILDKTPDGEEVGCVDLRNRMLQLKNLKLNIFGHIHHSYGVEKIDNITFANVSVCNERYRPVNKPMVFEYDSL